MTRMILITFAALGWSFYVMSGGPDFEPRGLRSAQPERVATAPQPEPDAKPIASAPAEELVTRAALRSTPPPEPETEPALTETEAQALPVQTVTGLRVNPSLFDDQSATLTLASLEQGVTALQQVSTDTEPVAIEPQPEPQKDIREISGTRVNMRDGPGTIYPIIAKVTIGQKVEVLSDSGTGWLRLRVLPAQQVGWISASLVRKTTN